LDLSSEFDDCIAAEALRRLVHFAGEYFGGIFVQGEIIFDALEKKRKN